MRKILRLFVLFALLLSVFSCGKQETEKENVAVSFGKYITAFPTGTISVRTPIQINLETDIANNFKEPQELPDDWFSISPKVKGKAYWTSSHTIVFKTEHGLSSGEKYSVDLHLDKLFPNVAKEYKIFSFHFETRTQDFEFREKGVYSYPNTELPIKQYKGTVLTADYIDGKSLEQILTVKYDGKDIQGKLTWQHSKNGIEHIFSIDSLQRGKEQRTLEIRWKGNKIGIEKEGELKIVIPSVNEFSILNMRFVKEPEQHLEIFFSDQLDKSQNLRGCVRINEDVVSRCLIDGSVLRVYPSKDYTGEQKVQVFNIVKNSFGKRLEESYSQTIQFDRIKPEVRLLGKGTISPSSQGLILPFEAVGLNAVDVRVIEIFENNIPQFLQENKLDGSRYLRRVGRLILNKKVALNKEKGMRFSRWNTYKLDLSKLVTVHPGAIYRVELRFRRSYAEYNCTETVEGKLYDELEEQTVFEEELKEWDKGEGWYSSYYYPSNYDWKERNNPCSDSYYNSNRFVSRNIFASNLGLIAKVGEGDKTTFAVLNLSTAKPESGVKLHILNYQNQEIAQAETNKEGFAEVQMERKPYLLIAQKGTERGYLTLKEGDALSFSNFEVAGLKIQKGVKGYIYGERGVWRPGDRIYLTFVLGDTNQSIPDNHPVVFDLKNPRGQVVKHIVRKKGKSGFYCFSFDTEDDAPTGRWIAQVKVGGVHFEKILKIETVKPNRLKINLDFNAPLLKTSQGNTQKAQMSIKWLHGAIASDLKANVSLQFGTQATKFEGYPRFVFDDPAKELSSEEQVVFDGTVDSNGEAEIRLPLKSNTTAPGMLNAYFKTKAFEQGGDFSIDMQKIAFAPYVSFVGMRMPEAKDGWFLTDTDHWVEVATVDAEGKPITVKNLAVTVYKIDWRWWWDASDEKLASYIERSSTRKVFQQTVATTNGKGRFKLNIPYRDWHDYGRYLIRVSNPESGHSTGTIAYFSKWYGRVPEGMLGNASLLSFTTDKKKYNVGETATVKFPSSQGAKALVSIEVGTRVLKMLWLDTTERETEFSFDVSTEMTPNAYVSIMMIQPHAQTENDRPMRMYGVCPLLVEDENTKLQPQIKMAESLQPEKEFTVRVSEKDSRKMTYTLAIVDEGLLDLTRFKTPNPWGAFYAREALGIQTWDMYDDVVGAFGARLERAFAVGGDESLSGTKVSKANRFKPVVFFEGPFELAAGETKKHKLKMPNYVGAVRAMVVAGNDAAAYGATEKKVPVNKPLMVLATLPRVLGPGETVKLPVSVFCMDLDMKKVQVQIVPNEFFKVNGDKQKIIQFDRKGEKLVDFDLSVAKKIGIAKVKVIVQSGEIKATHDIELEVRNANPRITSIKDTVLQQGQVWQYELDLPGMQGTNKAFVELSRMPTIDFGGRLDYLIEYPHGCIEQTTSGVLPQLFLSKVVELTPEQKARIKENVKAGLSRLMKFQLPNGGFSYWPGQSTPSDWGTSYAGNFILKAEEMGYSLPIGMKRSWLAYQKQQAQMWDTEKNENGRYYKQETLLQAYRLYTLALAGEPDLSAMNRLRGQKNIENAAKWRLIAAFQLAGKGNMVAKDMLQQTALDMKSDEDRVMTYGSVLRDKAMVLETFCLMGKQVDGLSLMKEITQQLSSNNWMSTQTTAYCLMATAQFFGKDKAVDLDVDFTEKGGEIKQIKTKLPVVRMPIEMKNTVPKITIKNKGKGVLYARVNMSGIPIVGSQQATQKNIKMDITYVDMKGKPLEVSKLQQGTDFKAVVRIKNLGILGRVENMALTQIFPSGWEILNTRLGDIANENKANVITYQDIRDDRVYSYFDLGKTETKELVVLLNATYAGRYYLPTVNCEAMYNDEIHAQVPGKWVEVTK